MTQTGSEYEQARARALRKRKFRGDVVGYLVINAFLIGIWAIAGFGYFWPAWIIGFWGVGLIMNMWDVYFRRPVTEHDIEQELKRIQR